MGDLEPDFEGHKLAAPLVRNSWGQVEDYLMHALPPEKRPIITMLRYHPSFRSEDNAEQALIPQAQRLYDLCQCKPSPQFIRDNAEIIAAELAKEGFVYKPERVAEILEKLYREEVIIQGENGPELNTKLFV